jgi:hypothetical protein
VESERIKTLQDYLRVNKLFGRESLKTASLSVGYTVEEFEKAWELSEVVSTETMSFVQKITPIPEEPFRPKSSGGSWVVPVLTIVWILLMAGAVAYMYVKGGKAPAVPTPISGLQTTASGLNKQVDVALAAEGLKVIMKGKLTFGTSSVDYGNGLIVYLHKGQAVRIEGGGTLMIKTADKLVSVDNQTKTYRVLPNDAPEFTKSFPLINIVKEATAWSGLDSETWETDWNMSGYPVKARIHVNPTTGLVDKFSLKSKDGGDWQELTLTYETVTGMADLEKIPEGYSESSL